MLGSALISRSSNIALTAGLCSGAKTLPEVSPPKKFVGRIAGRTVLAASIEDLRGLWHPRPSTACRWSPDSLSGDEIMFLAQFLPALFQVVKKAAELHQAYLARVPCRRDRRHETSETRRRRTGNLAGLRASRPPATSGKHRCPTRFVLVPTGRCNRNSTPFSPLQLSSWPSSPGKNASSANVWPRIAKANTTNVPIVRGRLTSLKKQGGDEKERPQCRFRLGWIRFRWPPG